MLNSEVFDLGPGIPSKLKRAYPYIIEVLLAASPALLLIFSAFLHAGWNTATKVSKDKDIFVLLTILNSCVLVLLWLLLQEEYLNIGGTNGFLYSVGAGVFEGFYLIAMAKAFSRMPMAKAYSILRGGAMVLVWAVSLHLGMEKLGAADLAGCLLVLTGIVLSGIRKSRIGDSRADLFWPLIGAAFIAGYHICYGKSLEAGAEPRCLFAVALAISLPFLIYSARNQIVSRVAAVYSREPIRLTLSTLSCAVGFLAFLYGLKNSGPGYAITLRNTSIFFSIGFSLFIRDSLTRLQLIGASIIGVGALLLGL